MPGQPPNIRSKRKRRQPSQKVPDGVWAAATVLKPEDHVGWDAIPAGGVSLDVGDQWSARLSSVLLIVPSVIVPEERNILINPTHPDVARLRARKLRRWTYDPRLV